VWSTGIFLDTTGPDLAQRLRMTLADLWESFAETRPGVASHSDLPDRREDVRPITTADLVTAEHALVAYSRRIERIVDQASHEPDGEEIPFISDPRLPTAASFEEGVGLTVLLRRVSQEAEKLAQILETLGPGELDIMCRSEHGVSTLAAFANEAVGDLEERLRRACRRLHPSVASHEAVAASCVGGEAGVP
jgi:hypothetical protein